MERSIDGVEIGLCIVACNYATVLLFSTFTALCTTPVSQASGLVVVFGRCVDSIEYFSRLWSACRISSEGILVETLCLTPPGCYVSPFTSYYQSGSLVSSNNKSKTLVTTLIGCRRQSEEKRRV